MRLKKLQVSGFKSFVNATDIRLPANLVGVVGPNGCGKSNVIDAVRWVMGESSARMLRGDRMEDVIFSGSAARKPVGKASVELLFDNADGSAGGGYASYAEISVRRTLSRDGQSAYFINRTRARRKDVLDLFLGTGLGPRAYAIIEQDMVSRIIEARPEDLRMFVEEAAGTSKYKARRRETENRIRQAQENLSRVDDIRNEIGKQLRRLKRQANAATRYRHLKEEKRTLDGQLQVLQLRELETQLTHHERTRGAANNAMEAATAAQRKTEADLARLRREHGIAQEKHNEAQQETYRLGADIQTIEQSIEHRREQARRRREELQRLQAGRERRHSQLESDQAQLAELRDQQAQAQPEGAELERRHGHAADLLQDAEIELQAWQEQWDALNEKWQALARTEEVAHSKVAQLQQHLTRADTQATRVQQELTRAREASGGDLENVAEEVHQHDTACATAEAEFQRLEEAIAAAQHDVQQQRDRGAALGARRHEASSRLASLREIQAAALGGDDDALRTWCEQHNLGGHPKLAARIRVHDGWERAADRVLNGHLSAMCVPQLPHTALTALTDHPHCAVTVIADGRGDDAAPPPRHAAPRLIDKVTAGDTDLSGFLDGVYLAESLAAALAMQPQLAARECVVTRDGMVAGNNWVSRVSEGRSDTGVLVREEEIHRLEREVAELDAEVATVDADIVRHEEQRATHQRQHAEVRTHLNQLRQENTALHHRLGSEQARQREIAERAAALVAELDNLRGHRDHDHTEITATQEALTAAAAERTALAAQRDSLQAERARHREALGARKEAAAAARDDAHQHALQQQRLAADLESTAAGIARLEQELQAADQQPTAAPDSGEEEDAALNTRLQAQLAQRVTAEQQCTARADAVAALGNDIAAREQQRTRELETVQQARDEMEQQQLAHQEIRVRRDTQTEQLTRDGHQREALEAALPEEAAVAPWQQRLATVEEKIDRIGSVNLAAIDEYAEENERKSYLDQQHADLTEAIDTLLGVIRKIDRETRARFKETFELLNAGFNEFFPRLFGGGHATLQLSGEDFLTAGVTVMARPPGKRNSHIHLLSGGEKALTAVALLFALFQLNPAPFCLLDEVDAPLDDANVIRYCDTLKSLSKVTQIIVITHNKITMEAAEVLVGVTMAEAGVSRLVSVDVDQAVALAASAGAPDQKRGEAVGDTA